MRFVEKIVKTLIIINIIININKSDITSAEPFSFAALLTAIGIGTLYSTWDYLKCSTNECCHRFNDNKAFVKGNGTFEWRRMPWIDYEMRLFEQDLNSQLHGQHLVRTLISKLIRKHLKSEKPDKALVLSFHGWTGGGKNFVSKIVAKSIFRKYRESEKSNFVHQIISTQFIGLNISQTRKEIENRVRNGIEVCDRSLFIFDEIDKLSVGVIDVIKPYIDFHSDINGIDSRKAMFIFLSNTGGNGVAKIAYDFYKEGKERTDLTIKDLEPLINSGAFNEMGGLYKSDIIEKHLIDAFVPFLPLEKKHIELCIIDYLKDNYNKSKHFIESLEGKQFIRNVANEMEYFPPDTKLYSKSGCKKVAKKVDVLID